MRVISRRCFHFVMTSIDDAPGLAPKIFRFSDVDEFRSSIRGLNVEFTPFVRRISAEQIILRLPGCDVNVTRVFPRVVDAQLVADCTAIGFTMDDIEVPIRFNGAQHDRCVIVVGDGGAAYNTVEEAERQIASLVFRPRVTDRGWPEARSNFKLFETSTAALHRLRHIVREVVAAASEPIDAVALDAVAQRRAEFQDVPRDPCAAIGRSCPAHLQRGGRAQARPVGPHHA
jgi:AraC family ethanolamine operon transcriptional activator